jgi:ribonucleotide reductase beta subunit family protein with ferritin-like domain
MRTHFTLAIVKNQVIKIMPLEKSTELLEKSFGLNFSRQNATASSLQGSYFIKNTFCFSSRRDALFNSHYSSIPAFFDNSHIRMRRDRIANKQKKQAHKCSLFRMIVEGCRHVSSFVAFFFLLFRSRQMMCIKKSREQEREPKIFFTLLTINISC